MSKNKNHGLLKPTATADKQPLIPQRLKAKHLRFNIPFEEALRVYGKAEMRALKGVLIAGKPIEAGDLFEVTGNDAVYLASVGLAEFTDVKAIEAEQAVIAEAEALGLEVKARKTRPGDAYTQQQMAAAADVANGRGRESSFVGAFAEGLKA